MTMSQKTLAAYADIEKSTLNEADKAYFRTRTKLAVYQKVLEEFDHLGRARGFTKADIARRLDVHPSQVTRWLSGPGNWTLDTVSDLLIAMGSTLSLTVLRAGAEGAGNKVNELSSKIDTLSSTGMQPSSPVNIDILKARIN